MKRIFIALFLSIIVCVPMVAQQSRQLRRSKTALYFPEFKDAKIFMSFGRFVKAKANILLKNGALCYLEGDNIMQANTKDIIGVEFDTVSYKKIDAEQMGRVVATKGSSALLCVTKVDMEKYEEETGEDESFLAVTGSVNDSQKWESDNGIPLEDKYYFYIKKKIVPANETKIKKFVRPEMKKAFKRLMADRWWSWHDEESLKQILPYLPE